MSVRALPIFLILAILAEILGTVGGFGSSVYFVPLANFFLEFKAVLGITALFHLSSNISKIALFKKGFDLRIALTLGLPAIVFVSIGAWASQFLDTSLLSVLLGVFLVGLSLLFLLFRKLVIRATDRNAVIGGVLSGFSAGLLGTGGAIRGITLAAFKMEKNRFVATSALIDLGVDLSRSVVYYLNGYMYREHLYLVPLLLGVAFVGTWLGKKILDRIAQDQFRTFVLLLILGIGIVSIAISAFPKA